MILLRYICILLAGSLVSVLFGQTQPGKVQIPVFDSYQIDQDIQYGQSVGINDTTVNLLLDVYTGTGDTRELRPLIIFIHGGGFRNGNKALKMSRLFCSSFAKSGFVAASIDYRLSNAMKSNDEYVPAMIRAVQDAKAAVRFFRKNAAKFRIDTSNIYAMGSSAGAVTALHMAYLDQNEVPSKFDLAELGSLEGNSGTPGYNSDVHGVINCWGALGDYRWITRGNAPVFSIHGVNDSTIAYDSSFSWRAFKYGSSIIHDRATKEGINSGLRKFYNTGHTLDNDPVKQDSAARDITAWLYSLMRKK